MGSITNFKKELLNLIRFQKRQIERFGVKCHINHEVTANTLKTQAPDIVILATGSLPSFPPVDGIDKEIVISVNEVLNSGQQKIEKAVVIGGGPTGCEVALHLSENGCQVTILEMLPKIGAPLESITKKLLIRKLKDNNVEIRTESQLIRVEDNGVVFADKDDTQVFIETSKVVVAVGSKPDNRLYNQIKSLGYEIHQIGDCLEPRSAKAAIYEGGVLGRSI